ncbi:hypothetical protein GDO81_014711 [Engystomops pustulosus]|uniref:Sodefrin-like factor n=1 Tax=Engystomops pustulosus TaxID=76066 RepID=A0AAV7BBZ7_ENGPU|nr:hypothetical protein GDO81_014711 [Engystomops pustulosus]
MTSILRLLFFLSTFLDRGLGLSCIECGSSSSPCSGTSVTCPSDFVCASTLAETTIGRATYNTFIRTCESIRTCNMKGNFATHESKYRFATTCCSTDDCTPPDPTLIPSNNVPNGRVCPVCESLNSTACDSHQTLTCTGNENKCVLFTTVTGDSSSSAIMGCATQSYCDQGNYSLSDGRITTAINVICSDGGASLQKIILALPIVCLLLLGWLLFHVLRRVKQLRASRTAYI